MLLLTNILAIKLAIFTLGGTFLDTRTILASTIALASLPVITEEVHASGNTNGSVNVDFLNVRTGPSTNFTILDVLQRQSNVTITGENGNWYAISYNNQTAYVNKRYITVSNTNYQVTADILRVRSGEGTTFSILGRLQQDDTIQVESENNGWCKITYNNQTGYVSKTYLAPIGSTAKAAPSPIFRFPTTGAITSGYGPRAGGFHHGIDIATPGTVQIHASAAGTVNRSYYSTSYGNVVFLTHSINGQMYTTVYAHMRNRYVNEGDTVYEGQLLGYMGSTGDATGQHLHFELHTGPWNINKTNGVNPLPYFR